ncbi:MAG TPA: hypothetical protein VE912_26105 [Bacteroidales bacterium]|nr:hypothetical protein [Bacteroidales bacterium]
MKNKVIIFVIAIVSLFFSCDRMETYTNVQFLVINNSAHNVKLHYFVFMTAYYSVKDTIFHIPENSEIRIIYEDDMGSSIYGSDSPLGLRPDSVYITFDNTKRIIYRQDDSFDKGILDINNYVERKTDEHNYEFSYTITGEDYNNAEKLK